MISKKMYVIVTLILSLVLLLNAPAYGADQAAADQTVKVTLDSKLLVFPDAQPYIDDDTDRTMVPVRFISENMGGDVSWEQSTNTATLKQGEFIIKLKLGDKFATVTDIKTGNTEIKYFDASIALKEDRTFVPLRFVSETLGCGVGWDPYTWTVIIRTDGIVLNTTGKVDINIAVNGQSVTLPINPELKGSDIFVPVRAFCGVIGADIEASNIASDVVVKKDNNTIQCISGKNAIIVNGNAFTIGDQIYEIDGSMMAPVKFMVENLGGTYKWDAANNTANISITVTAADKIIIPAATTEFVPYLPELTPVDAATLAELKLYPDNQGTSTGWLKLKFYRNNAELIEEEGIEQVKEYTKIAKGYLETYYNSDYRSLDENYLKQLRYFYMPGSFEVKVHNSDKNYTLAEYTKMYVEDLIKYKVSLEGAFDTDTSLTYVSHDGDWRIRGRLKFRYNSADNAFFDKYESCKTIKIGQWYYVDTEVAIAHLCGWGTDNWQHSFYCYSRCYDFSEYQEVK